MNDGSDCGRAALSAAQIDIRSEWVAQRLSAVISAKLAHPSFYSVILRQRSRSRSEHFQWRIPAILQMDGSGFV